MKDKETQNNIFDILDKFEFFQGQRAGRELWRNKPKEVQDKDIADFIKDINYIRSYLQNSIVLSREEWECLHNDYAKALYNARQNEHKEMAEKILKDFKLWAREYQNKDTVIDDYGERPMTNNEKLNYLYIYLCDKYKVEIKE